MTPEQIKHIREWLDGVPKQVNGARMPPPQEMPYVPSGFCSDDYTVATVKPNVRVSVAQMYAGMGGPFTRTTTSESDSYEALCTAWADNNEFIGWLIDNNEFIGGPIDDQEVDAPTA